MDDDVVASIRDLYRYFEIMTRDHFVLDDDYDDDMIWWDYLYGMLWLHLYVHDMLEIIV